MDRSNGQWWWEKESPTVISTSKNVIRWYPKAKKLQLSRPDWQDGNGDWQAGKTVTLDLEALSASENAKDAADLLREISGIIAS